MALLEVVGVELSFYGVQALSGVDLSVQPHGITGLIGPNGAGKTTLFNCITGVVPPDRGRIVFDWQRDRRVCGPTRSVRRGLVAHLSDRARPAAPLRLENLLLYGSASARRAPAASAVAHRVGAAREEELVARARRGRPARLNLYAVIEQSRFRPVGRSKEAARDRPCAHERAAS